MKKHFPGYFAQSKADIRRLWNSCIFVVDVNILLNLYRYSDKTREEFLHVLDSIQDRLWLPHRAAEEFFANRLTVIGQQEKAYDNTIQTIDTLQQDLANVRQHPFVSESTMKKVQQVFDRLKSELSENQKVNTKRITNDSIQASIAKIFSGRVGEPYDNERLNAIFKEGETRYSERIPPGFTDDSKADGNGAQSERCRKYGDLLVWFQILEHAKEKNVSMILVTDDKKKDWWQTFKGKTIGPRPELVQEFLSRTHQSFHMYQADRFLEFANEYLEQTIAETTLSEIRELRHRDVEARNIELYRREQEMARRIDYDAMSSRVNALSEHYSSLVKKREELMYHRQILQESTPKDVSDAERDERFIGIFSQEQAIKEKISSIEEELSALEDARRHLQRDLRIRRRIIEPEPGAYADKPRR